MSRRALVANVADEGQVRAGRKQKSIDAKGMREDWRATLATRQGRNVVWQLLDFCGAFRSVFSEDAARMGYRAGKQDVGHFTIEQIEQAAPEALYQMMREHAPDAARDEDPDTQENTDVS